MAVAITDSAQTVDDAISNVIDGEIPLHSFGLVNLDTSNLYVTNMTILVSLRQSRMAYSSINLMLCGTPATVNNVHLQLRPTSFGSSNQLQATSLCGAWRNVCVKVFALKTGGTGLHFTGCKTLAQAKEIAVAVLGGDDADFEREVNGFDVQLINTSFSFNVGINLTGLADRVRALGMTARYNRDLHPGAIIRYTGPDVSKPICIIAFMTGSTIITGAKCAEDVKAAYKFIVDLVDENYEDLHLRVPQHLLKKQRPEKGKRGRKRKSDTISFYRALQL